MPELPLDDVQRDALPQQFKRMRVAQLMGGKAPTHAGAGRASTQRGPRR